MAEVHGSKNEVICKSFIMLDGDFNFFFPAEKCQLLIPKLFTETDQDFLICHLESVKCKTDVLNTTQFSCLSFLKVDFTRENRDLSFSVLALTI